MEKKSAIAIITARGGSKRIPRKNIRDFCGKPILAYSIEAALSSKAFDEVMVSTEDAEIAGIAEQYGAKVPFLRSAEASGDYAATADVLLEVLEQYRALGREFQYGCCIYPTAPFVTAEKLRNAMGMLGEDGASSVIPVTAFSFPPMRGFLLEDGKAQYAFPEYAPKRSQDIPAMYHDCGQFYCFQVDAFLESRALVAADTRTIIMPEMEVQDIDNEQDWQLAEVKYQLMREKMENAGKGRQCFLRKAGWEDMEQIFLWANDSEVRKNSFSMAPIPYGEHRAWYERKLKEEGTQIYIFCDGALEVGALRLEFGEEGAMVSYSIAPEYRNRGYGQKLISLAEQEVLQWAKGRKKVGGTSGRVLIKAQVKAENQASNKIFTKAGYEAYSIGYQKAIDFGGE